MSSVSRPSVSHYEICCRFDSLKSSVRIRRGLICVRRLGFFLYHLCNCYILVGIRRVMIMIGDDNCNDGDDDVMI